MKPWLQWGRAARKRVIRWGGMPRKQKPQQTPNDDGAAPTSAQPALPAQGRGPLAGYPVPAGATHWRLHGVGDDGRIRDALPLGDTGDGPITRAPVALLGDAALWDAVAPGARVRVVFSRYHGDILKTRIGQGPIWVVPPRGETADTRAPTPAPEPAPPASGDHTLFLVLRQLQKEASADADARAARELGALRELYSTQAEMTRSYFAQMTSMFLAERRDERDSAARERRETAKRDRALLEQTAAATRQVVREELDAARDDDEDDAAPIGDPIEQALTGLTETVRPIAAELTRRAVNGASS